MKASPAACPVIAVVIWRFRYLRNAKEYDENKSLTKDIELMSVLLEFPLAIVQWANLSSLEPSRNAVEVEGVVANSPGNRALLTCRGCLIGLAFDAEIHDVVSANGAVVDDDVPGPQSHGVPLLHLEPLFAAFLTADCGRATGRRRRWDFLVNLH